MALAAAIRSILLSTRDYLVGTLGTPIPSATEKKAWLLDLDGTIYRAKPLKVAMAAELALAGSKACNRKVELRPYLGQ